MNIPEFRRGEKLRGEDLQALSDAIRANRVLPGAGIRITGSPYGTTVALSVPPAGPSSTLRLHDIGLIDLIPNPQTIITEVLEDVLDLFFAAVPAATQVANSVADLATAALTSALPTANKVASSVQSLVSSILTGSGGGSNPSNLFSNLSDAAPEASAVFDAIAPLFDSAFGVLDQINELIDAKFQEYSGLGSSISDHFRNKKTAPRPGDYLYTEEMGILYTVFPVNPETGIPSTNLIFRVHFTIGEGENAVRWCALTTFPAPDIAAFCRMIARLLRKLIEQAIELAAAAAQAALAIGAELLESAASSLLAIADGVAQAVKAAIQILRDLIDQILQQIQELWQAISALQAALNSAFNSLRDDLSALETYARDHINSIWEHFNTLWDYVFAAEQFAQDHINSIWEHFDSLWEHLATVQGELQTALNEALGKLNISKTLRYIGIDGREQTLNVLTPPGAEITAGEDMFKDLKYLDNLGTPQGIRAIWVNGPAAEGVTKETITVCNGESSVSKRFLVAP